MDYWGRLLGGGNNDHSLVFCLMIDNQISVHTEGQMSVTPGVR